MSSTLFGKGYDPKEGSDSIPQLPAGGYEVRIMDAKIQNAKSSGLPMVVIQFDICEGEYRNYYHQKYDNDTKYRPDADYRGLAYIPAVDEKGNQRDGFNKFCGAVEKSNNIKLPNEDVAFLNALKGSFVGIIFGREEYIGNDGKAHWNTKPRWFRSTQTIESGDFTIPDDKYLDKPVPNTANTGFAPADTVDSFSAAEDDIPF